MPPLKKKKESPKDEIDYGKVTLDERSYYEQSTQSNRQEWEELWKLYIGELPESKVKSLSRNFIPKTHQAVEASASFLVGNEPTIIAIPVGAEDDDKAKFMGRLLEFQWQYVLKMKPKLLTWVKSGLLFGVGVMKVGWDADTDQPFAYPVNLGNFFTDPFTRDLQEAPSVIERIVLPLAEVEKRYKVKGLKPMSAQLHGDIQDGSIFDSHDIDTSIHQGAVQRVEILERWTMDNVYTVAIQQKSDKQKGTTETVGRVLRNIPNPLGFIPYVPFRPKDSPLPNRFYNQGVIAPVKRVHKRMNQLVNQIVDNTNLIMSPAAKVRRGSGVNYREVGNMFPGKVITMNDIQRDVEFITIPDTTGTGFNLYNALDREFQQGTSITDLRQGSDAPSTAGAARIQQANLNTQTTLVKENVEYAIAEMGQMLCKLNIDNITTVRSIRIFDPEDIAEFDQMLGQGKQMTPQERQDIQRNGRVFTMDKGQLDGEYDIRIKADSTLLQNRDILRKQLIDFTQFLNGIGVQLDVMRIAEKWGELSGIPNVSKFIRKESPPPPQPPPSDPAKMLQALADLAKAGEPISNAQLQAAMQIAGLPPNLTGPDPNEAYVMPDTPAEQPQNQLSVGPGGGQSLGGGPTPSDTSVSATAQGAEDAASVMTQ